MENYPGYAYHQVPLSLSSTSDPHNHSTGHHHHNPYESAYGENRRGYSAHLSSAYGVGGVDDDLENERTLYNYSTGEQQQQPPSWPDHHHQSSEWGYPVNLHFVPPPPSYPGYVKPPSSSSSVVGGGGGDPEKMNHLDSSSSMAYTQSNNFRNNSNSNYSPQSLSSAAMSNNHGGSGGGSCFRNGGVHISNNLSYHPQQPPPTSSAAANGHGHLNLNSHQQNNFRNVTDHLNSSDSSFDPKASSAAVVRQLQEKFGNGTCPELAPPQPTSALHSSSHQHQHQTTMMFDHNMKGGENFRNPNNPLLPYSHQATHHHQNQNNQVPLNERSRGGNADGGGDDDDDEGGSCFLLDSIPCFNFCDDTAVDSSSTAAATSAAENGGGVGGGKVVRGDGTVVQENYDGWKSLWIHCRLPLLLILVFALLIVFLSFSGIILYFKYIPYKARGYGSEDEPCELTNCAFGSSCYVENGRAICRCPENCPSNYDPVCSNDDHTYSNECLLRLFACQHQKSIRIRHGGECDTPDPCRTKICPFGSRCVPTLDGRYATCECPTSCPNNLIGPDTLDMSSGVCGSDGKYYRNRCELDREACRWMRNITVKFHGKCDPCEDFVCSPPQVCQLDGERRPTCRCGEVCSMEFNPVCASDGKTYTSECAMRQEACKKRQDLRIIYRGKCSSGSNPCETRSCRGFETCAINRFGIATCSCNMKCDPVIQPVCGSNGKSYDNECELTLTSCLEATHISVSYRGTCEAASACAKHNCPPESICIDKDGQTVCECPVCPSDYSPVCGSDGVSYQNACRLRMEACLTNTKIRKIYAGLCNGCDNMQCDFYSVCQASMTETKCVCSNNCSSQVGTDSKVCGTDGITYESECELQKSACRLQKFVVVASKGHCDSCANVQCKFGAVCENGSCICPIDCPPNKEPVCGNNGLTYNNECELQKASCKIGRPLSVHFYGECLDRNRFTSKATVQLTTSSSTLRKQGGGEGGENEGSIIDSTATATSIPVSFLDESNSGGGGGDNSEKGDSSLSSSTSLLSLSGEGMGMGEGMEENERRFKLCATIVCDFGAVCELAADGFPRCTCQFTCTSAPGSALCGSDLRWYASECEMRRDACHRQTELRPRPKELCDETSYGNVEGGSTTSTATATTTTVPVNNSLSSQCGTNGCCSDGVTPALGPNQLGCPSSICHCNKLGSVNEACDLVTQECQCRVGVGGPQCDRCLPGFWGLTRSNDDRHLGCKECGCTRWGSVRDDCEQMTGRCVCKSGVLGHKCDSCRDGEFLGPYGCTPDSWNLGRTCDEIVCEFGADCEQEGDRAGCICNLQCSNVAETEEICASDGFTYESECLLHRQSCRSQKPLHVVHKGPCPAQSESDGTESPLPRWTGLHFTEPGDDGTDSMGPDDLASRSNGEIWSDNHRGAGLISSSGMKSTRHLPPQSKYEESFHKNFYTHRSPTAATIQMRSYLGDSCQWTADCVTAHSVCLGGWCICREGFHYDSERVQCKPIHSHLSGLLSCSKSSSLQCESPSTCFDHRNGSYSCVCPLGTAEPNNGCTREEPLYPFLNGRSTIALDKLAGHHKLSLELEITPYLNYEHGILIFASQHVNGSGDFLSLSLIDGFVEFRYDLGDGPAILRSSTRVLSGSAHHIVAKRYNRDGLLRVDGEEDVKGTSPGSMKSLNLDHGGYIGHVPLNSTKIWETVGTSEGFVGCIHKLRVGRRPIDFVETKDPLIRSISKVSQCPVISSSNRLSTTPMYTIYEAAEEEERQTNVENNILPVRAAPPPPPLPLPNNPLVFSSSSSSATSTTTSKKNSCSKAASSCKNHGICWNDQGSSVGYKCVCHPEYSGKHCESRSSKIEETGAMLDFRGFSYLEVPKIENAARHVAIEMWVMVRAYNGLILYNGQEMGKGDFVTVMVSNGHIQFFFDLGSGMANLTWNQPITLNKWHWIVAIRDGREASLQINGQLPQTIKSPPTLSELNLELPLYVGGIRDLNMIHRELGLLNSFDGVFQYLRVNGETYHREISSALRQRLVHRYEGPPCGSSVSPPCSNGGTCFPRLESFVCLCPQQFTGKSCEKRRETPGGPVRFNGENFLKFPRKIAKHESFNLTDYDDFYNEQFDSQLDELFGSSSSSSSFSSTSSLTSETTNNDDEGEEDENEMEDNEEYLLREEDGEQYDDDIYDFEDVNDSDDFVPFVEEDIILSPLWKRSKAQRKNRIEVLFRTTSELPGVVLWTGKRVRLNSRSRRGHLGLFLVDGGFVELWVDLGAGKNKKSTVIRSKIKVSDGRWHQILIARQRRLIVLQVDGSIPQRATAPVGSNVLVSDGRYWIGGVMPSVLPADIPPTYHQGFVGCVDVVRIEKRRLPLAKIAYTTGTGLQPCEDDD